MRDTFAVDGYVYTITRQFYEKYGETHQIKVEKIVPMKPNRYVGTKQIFDNMYRNIEEPKDENH